LLPGEMVGPDCETARGYRLYKSKVRGVKYEPDKKERCKGGGIPSSLRGGKKE